MQQPRKQTPVEPHWRVIARKNLDFSWARKVRVMRAPGRLRERPEPNPKRFEHSLLRSVFVVGTDTS